MRTLLWLDDKRDPSMADWLLRYAPDFHYDGGNVVWVKDYDEFVRWIEKNGLPYKIAFDHDLGLGKSGYDAAHYVVDYCLDNGTDLPLWTIQSSNTVGVENIDGLFRSFLKHN